MSYQSDLMIVIINKKTGKELACLIKQVPRIGDEICINQKVIYKVKDVVWDSYWRDPHRLNHEVRIYVLKSN